MTKLDLVNDISQTTGIDKFTIMRTIESFMETVIQSMSNDKNVYMRGFGTFEVKKRAKKTARNITKNTIVIIPEHFVPTFRPCKEFVELVKNKIPNQK